MNPALAASGSGGLAGAIVVVFNALLQHFFAIVPDPNVVVAEATIATAVCGVGAHYLTRVVPPLPAPANAPAAAPATFPVVALLALFLGSAVLSGCAALGLTGDPANDVPVIAGDIVKVCKDLGPLAAPLAAAPNASVQAAGVVAIYASSVCDGNGNVLADIPLAGDTAAWAKVLLGEIQAAQGVTAPVPAAAPAAVPSGT